MQAHVDDVNCVPLSVVIVCGVPNLATHSWTKVSAHTSAVIDFSGITSGHLVLLSTIVNR